MKDTGAVIDGLAASGDAALERAAARAGAPGARAAAPILIRSKGNH